MTYKRSNIIFILRQNRKREYNISMTTEYMCFFNDKITINEIKVFKSMEKVFNFRLAEFFNINFKII